MPSNLVRRQAEARAKSKARTHAKKHARAAPRAAGAPFHEVASIPGQVPLDAWAGWDGSGWGPSGSLWVTTGTRQGGSSSQVFRLDSPDGEWVNDGAPGGAETLNKIRNGHSRADNLDYLAVFFETPKKPATWLIARRADTGWQFVGVPETSRSYDDPVGGRGLAFKFGGPPGGPVVAGASFGWRDRKQARVFDMQSDGGWNKIRDVEPSLLWELEFDGEGRLWEFFNDFGSSRHHRACLRQRRAEGAASWRRHLVCELVPRQRPHVHHRARLAVAGRRGTRSTAAAMAIAGSASTPFRLPN